MNVTDKRGRVTRHGLRCGFTDSFGFGAVVRADGDGFAAVVERPGQVAEYLHTGASVAGARFAAQRYADAQRTHRDAAGDYVARHGLHMRAGVYSVRWPEHCARGLILASDTATLADRLAYRMHCAATGELAA